MAKEDIININSSPEEPDWIEIDVNDSTMVNNLYSDFNDNDLVEAIFTDADGNEIPDTSFLNFDDEYDLNILIIDDSDNFSFDTTNDVVDL